MKHRASWTPYLFLLPALVLLGISSFWPAFQALYYSLTSYDLLGPPQFVGLENFRELWGDRIFWQVLRNTLVYLVVAVPLLVFLPLVLAILANQPVKGIQLFRVLYYLPVVVSVVVAGIAWKWIYAENGLLNYILSALTFHTVRIPWLTDTHLAIYAVIAVTVWRGLGYYMVIYLAGLQAIPASLYEAAAIDGSDGWQKHWDVTLPLMRPYLWLVTVISAIAAMKVFEEVYVMTRGEPANSTKTLVYYLYEQGFSSLNMGYAAALGVVLFLVVLGLSLSTVRLLHLRGGQL
jgi:putative chitobiose transport system permease protein